MKKVLSLAEQLTDVSSELFGVKIDYVEKQKTEKRMERNRTSSKIKLNLKAKTNSDIKGYSYRTVCYVTDAVLPDNYVIDEKRLDAPCEMCINRQCPNSWGEIRR